MIEPEVIEVLGADRVTTYLNDVAARLRLKAAAREALADLDYFDGLVNDPQWKTTRLTT